MLPLKLGQRMSQYAGFYHPAPRWEQPPDCCQPGLRQCLRPGECVNGGCRGGGWSPHFEMHFVYWARDAEGDDACGFGAVLCSGSVATNTDADTGPRRCARLCAIFAECAACACSAAR